MICPDCKNVERTLIKGETEDFYFCGVCHHEVHLKNCKSCPNSYDVGEDYYCGDRDAKTDPSAERPCWGK